MIRLTPIKPNFRYYNTIEEAIVDANPHFRKLLLPDTVKQYPATQKAINLMKTFGKKCGLKIKGRFPEDIIKYEEKLKYAKNNTYKDVLKEFMDILTNNQKDGIVGEVLLNFRLRTSGNKILKKAGFTDTQI